MISLFHTHTHTHTRNLQEPLRKSRELIMESRESLGLKEIKPVDPKGSQLWIFIGRTDVEAEALILWVPDAKSWLFGKDHDNGKDWGQEKKGATEDEMVGWHQWLNGHEFEHTPGGSEGQGSPACCSPRGHEESDMIEWLNNNLSSVIS